MLSVPRRAPTMISARLALGTDFTNTFFVDVVVRYLHGSPPAVIERCFFINIIVAQSELPAVIEIYILSSLTFSTSAGGHQCG